MSSALRTDLARSRHRLGFSLVEVMVALLVFLIFISSAATVFVQIVQTSDEVDAKIEAVNNARFLLDAVSRDLAEAVSMATVGPVVRFNAIDDPLSHGDLVDNDGDGVIDEESPDAIDNDGDWMLADNDNNFADVVVTGGYGGLPPTITINERGWQVPSLGDGNVDEDVVFQNDIISFWIPGPSGGDITRQQVTYAIETFEGEDNVAVRRVVKHFTDSSITPAEEVGPLAFNVVSLNFLCWNHESASPQWETSWASDDHTLYLPSTVYAEIIVHASSLPLSMPPSREMPTIRMETMVNVESVLRSALFPRGEDREEGEAL